MKSPHLSVLVLAGLAGLANAATLVRYLDGTAVNTAYNEAAGITGSSLSYESNDSFRTSFGGDTLAGPTAGTSAGSNWMLWRGSNLQEAFSATANYAGFTIDIGAAADGTTLGNLTFDLFGAVANLSPENLELSYQVFADTGSGFSAVGSPSAVTELVGAHPAGNSLSPRIVPDKSDVLTGVVDLSGLGVLSTGDSVDIRIVLQTTSDGSLTANTGVFMQGILLEAVPEPGSMALVGIGCLLMISRRRRA